MQTNENNTARKPAAKPRDTLPPNKYSTAYALALMLTVKQAEVKLCTLDGAEGLRIYECRGQFYHYAFVDKAPPVSRLFWFVEIGRRYGRVMYRGVRRPGV